MQQQVVLTCRSLTYAQMTKRALDATGVTAAIIRTPQELTARGCGYAARIPEKDLRKALNVLSNVSLRPERVFRVSGTSYIEVKL